MKRVLFYLLGLLVLVVGIALEGGFIAGVVALILHPWAALGALVILCSCIIGDRIYRYGFRENTKIQEEKNGGVENG